MEPLKEITKDCKDCGDTFTITVETQEQLMKRMAREKRTYSVPVRCKKCLDIVREERRALAVRNVASRQPKTRGFNR